MMLPQRRDEPRSLASYAPAHWAAVGAADPLAVVVQAVADLAEVDPLAVEGEVPVAEPREAADADVRSIKRSAAMPETLAPIPTHYPRLSCIPPCFV